MKINREFRAGIVFAFLNAFSLGIVGIIDKIGASQSGINPFIFSTQSMLSGLFFVVLFACIYRRKALINDLKKTSMTSWKLIFLIGVFTSGIATTLRFLGLMQSTGTFATLVQIIITSMTAILAFILLRERLSSKFWVLFVIIVIATYFVSVGQIALIPVQVGDAYILAGTIFIAFSNIFSKQAVRQASPFVIAIGRFLFGGFFLLAIYLLFFYGDSGLLTITIWSILSGLFWAIITVSFFFSIQRISVTFSKSILMLETNL